ncbi:hypothetical protein NMY22_g16510 [Coprinellus aureogranulatus]|nr:hypothetical protein NMY22_g16510 [Coprinellus aureogranulatus]
MSLLLRLIVVVARSEASRLLRRFGGLVRFESSWVPLPDFVGLAFSRFGPLRVLAGYRPFNPAIFRFRRCRGAVTGFVGFVDFMVSTSPVRWLHLFMESDTWIHRSCRTEIGSVEWDMGDILAFGELIVYTDGQTCETI